MAGWLKGQVKEVLSGDSVVIIGGVSKDSLAVAPEKRITLSSLVAPRLVSECGEREARARQARSRSSPGWLARALTARSRSIAQGKRDGTSKDEPFAWESREFLRKKLIGQVRAREGGEKSGVTHGESGTRPAS